MNCNNCFEHYSIKELRQCTDCGKLVCIKDCLWIDGIYLVTSTMRPYMLCNYCKEAQEEFG